MTRWLCFVVAAALVGCSSSSPDKKTLDPLDNVLNDRLISQLLGANRDTVEPCFLVGFEKAGAWAEEKTTTGKLHEDGRFTSTMSSNRGSLVTTECHPRPDSRRGTLNLADGRTIQLNRIYKYNDDGTMTIQDTSTITDARGQELRNNLVETSNNLGNIVSIVGVVTSTTTGEHKINRTYTYIRSSEYRVQHTDNK